MAVSCFDFRMRATSFDLHNITSGPKFARFSRLFRSKSDSDVKKSPPSSPTPGDSAKPSPGAPQRRRFVRVIRDNISEGEEYENPHVVRKYTKGFWEKKNTDLQSQSIEEGVSASLPYTVTGHTILKKRLATESHSEQSSPSSRHACFKEEVSVIEFDKKEKIVKRVCHFREEKLIDSDEYDSETAEQSDVRVRKNYKKAPTNIESGKLMKQNTCPIDGKAFKGTLGDGACADSASDDGRISPTDMSEESEGTEDCDDSVCSDYTDMIASEVTKSLSDSECDSCVKSDCTITERVIASHLELTSKQRGPLVRQVEMES